MAKAWAVFSVDPNGKREYLDSFEAPDFSRRDAVEHAEGIREMEHAGGCTVEVVPGLMCETEQGPMFQER